MAHQVIIRFLYNCKVQSFSLLVGVSWKFTENFNNVSVLMNSWKAIIINKLLECFCTTKVHLMIGCIRELLFCTSQKTVAQFFDLFHLSSCLSSAIFICSKLSSVQIIFEMHEKKCICHCGLKESTRMWWNRLRDQVLVQCQIYPMFIWRQNSTTAEEVARFQCLFLNASWLMSGRTSGHQNLVSIFPWIDNCLKAKR